MSFLVLQSSYWEKRAGCFAFLRLSYGCLVTVSVLWLFFTVPWIGLQFLIEVFADHSHYFSPTFIMVIVDTYL